MIHETKREPVFQEVGAVTSNELPHLSIKRVRGTADFVTEDLELHARGWTHDEAVKGMVFLLEKIKALPK